MTRNSIKNAFDLDIDIDFEAPAVKTYPNQTSLPCYGRGKRLCDLRVPEIPKTVVTLNENKIGAQSSEAKRIHGRGRGRSRRSVVKEGKEFQDRSASPGGLQSSGKSSTDSQSVCSDHSSKDSEQFQGHDREDSKPQNNQHDVHSSPRLQRPVTSMPGQIKTGASSRKHSNDSSSIKNDGGWTILPPKVIQVDGIPFDFDLNIFYEMISSYATIKDWEDRRIDGCVSLRIKFSNSDVCDLIETNMDKSDFTGTGSEVRCIHLKHC